MSRDPYDDYPPKMKGDRDSMPYKILCVANLYHKVSDAAIREVFGPPSDDGPHIALGSVKSMIGHIIPASGAAGLIKVALALHSRVLPPMLCAEPNPDLGLDETACYLNLHPRPWVHGATHPRRAAVNAFGFGGINAHALLEECNEPLPVGGG